MPESLAVETPAYNSSAFAGVPSTPALRAQRRPAPEEIAFTGSGTEVDNHARIRAAHACNIGGFFSALPSLALSVPSKGYALFLAPFFLIAAKPHRRAAAWRLTAAPQHGG